MPAALRHFRVAILIQIGVERNERVIERIALDPDPRRTRLGCRDRYFIDATEVPFQRQLPGLAGFDRGRAKALKIRRGEDCPSGECSRRPRIIDVDAN